MSATTQSNPLSPSTETLRRRVNWALIASYVILLILALTYIGPIFMLFNTSFKSLSEFFKDATGLAPGLDFSNYVRAWELAKFPTYLVNSALYTTVATVICVLTSVFLAFPLARGYFRHSGAILTLYVVALFLPPALIPQFQLILNLGLYNTRIGYILLFLINPIGVIILVNYIKSIPRELDESAAMDGCGYFRFVLQIILPLIRPAVATITVLHAIGIWNELIAPTIYLTNADLYPVTRGLIVFEGVYGSDWPALAAAVIILMIPMLILFMFLQRYIIAGLTSGSVKG
jgi:raffinose/stachyose/melibiose transport system permease protein